MKAGFPTTSPTLIISDCGVKIASGSDHLVILTSSQEILTMGCAEQGQLGRIPEVFCSRGGRRGAEFLLKPQIVRFRKPPKAPRPKFLDVFCGTYHTFALTDDEAVYTWGLNNYGQLGTDDTESRYQPQRLPEDWIKKLDLEEEHNRDTVKTAKKSTMPSLTAKRKYENLEISGGPHHTLLCNKGSVFVMGRKEYGRLGLGQEETKEPLEPKRVPELSGVRAVAAGTACSFAVGDSGEVYSWGMGTNLQLGTGDEEDLWRPMRVGGKKLEGRKVVGVSLGGQHTALLVSSLSE